MLKLDILIIEDDIILNSWYRAFFSKLQFPFCTVHFAESLERFREIYQTVELKVAIVDYFLPDGKGTEAISLIKELYPQAVIILASSLDDNQELERIINQGIDFFLSKPYTEQRLSDVLNMAYEKNALVYHRSIGREMSKEEGSESRPVHPDEIVYCSRKMDKVMDKVCRVASSEATVLIRGESGTGKELVTRAIHKMSRRNDKPFVALNIAALPDSLIESELFGYRKGAFTGAESDRKGLFEEADGGTIFIDEIGDIPVQTQVKLLRIIQFKQVQRIGENITRDVDLRIIAATSRNIEQMVKEGTFREDLFYRLSVVTIHVPPLRNRREDIVPLIENFVRTKGNLHGRENLNVDQRIYEICNRLSYPGNVRELGNIIEHAVIMCRGNSLTLADLPDYILEEEIPDGEFAEASFFRTDMDVNDSSCGIDMLLPLMSADEKIDYEQQMRNFERKLISGALEMSGGHQTRSAEMLGISERKLRYRMQVLDISNTFRN